MNICVTSAFRNSPNAQIERWCRQVNALRKHAGPNHHVWAVAVEGDSIDGTEARLRRQADREGIAVQVIVRNLRVPIFGSTESRERMVALSKVLATCFDAVSDDVDVVLHIESDLIWSPDSVGTLIDTAYERRGEVDVAAPLVMAGAMFYDVWGFRGLDGRRFSPTPPFYPGLFDHTLFEVGSAGSCLAIRGEVARAVRADDGNALVGWCKSAREAGAKIAVVPTVTVRHPA